MFGYDEPLRSSLGCAGLEQFLDYFQRKMKMLEIGLEAVCEVRVVRVVACVC